MQVSLDGAVISRRAELEALGSQVRVLEGLNHTRTMQAVHVLPILRPVARRQGGHVSAWVMAKRPDDPQEVAT